MPELQEPFDQYLTKKYISPSSFKSAEISTPAHIKANMEREHTSTKSTDFGSAFHCKILTPNLYNNEFAELNINKFPDGFKAKDDGFPDLRDMVNKKIYEKFIYYNSNKTILDPSQTEMIKKMETNYYKCKNVTGIIDLKTCKIENSLYFLAEFDNDDNFIQLVDLDYDTLTEKDKKRFIRCKTRPDSINEGLGIGADLKTSLTAHPKKFPNEIIDYGYHIQAAMVMDAYFAVNNVMLESFIFVVCEKKEPFVTIMYECVERLITAGRNEYVEYLTMIKKAMTSNVWLGYESMSEPQFLDNGTIIEHSSILPIDLPNYYYFNKNKS
jgi:hypothetical protein